MASLPNWHPFLVHFPAALFTFALVCDLSLVARFRLGWLDRAVVLLYVGGALGAIGAAVSGKLASDSMVERLSPAASEAVAAHGDWAFFTVLVMFAAAGLRFDVLWRDRDEPRPLVHKRRVVAVAVAALATAVLIETAGRGGELVYLYRVAIEPMR